MRQTKRILALLLILVLGLALYPAAAMADPPEDGEATHKHSWQITYQRQPSCEEDGIIVWTCSLCGKNYSEYPPALGHDWDNGTVTRPADGFTPAEITYTCKRDASHTEVREINPVPFLFPPLLGFAPPTLYSNTLRITQQPEGGRIARGSEEGHTMTVAAEGGEGGYTYVWHYTDNGGAVNGNAMDTSLMATINGSKTDYSSAMADFYAAVGPLLESQGHGDWMPTVSPSVDPGPDLLGWRESGTVDCKEPSYTATMGNCGYYCVVWDSAGHHATSNTVRVEYRLSIRTQPKNTNLPAGGEAELICQAADGTGNYTYTWMKADGGAAEGTSKEPGHFTVTETGDYYCVVSDGEETVESRPATVYEAEDLVPVDWLKDTRKWPEDSLELFVRFEGGTPPYHCEWTCGGETVKAEDSDTPLFTLTVEDYERYDCDVTDAMGQTAGIIVRAVYRELAIARQPESCYLPAGGSAELSIEMAESGDYRYLLIRNADRTVLQENNTGVFQVDETGMYNIGVYEHAHPSHSALSNYAVVRDDVLRMTDQTESAEITDPNRGVNLSVTVEGGSKPYTYYWFVYKDAEILHDAGWYETGSNSNTIGARTPGKYYCRVKDAEDHWIDSHFIPVSYDGDAPLITLQPNDVYFEYSEESQAWGLICDAIPGKGGNAEDLIFEWYYRFPEDSDFSRVSGGRDKKIRVVSYPSSGSSPDWDCGYYYCKVTDTATGKSTDSRIATVNVELSITDAKFSNLSTVVGCGEILYKMQGGHAPYTVEFWGYWSEGYMGQKTPTLAESIDKSYADPNTWYSSPALPYMHDYIDYYSGMPKWRREFPTYCIVVVDALGQRIVYEDPDLHYNW